MIPDVLAGAEKSVVAYADNEARLPVVTVGVPIRMRDSIVGCVICSAEINSIDGLISRYMSQLARVRVFYDAHCNRCGDGYVAAYGKAAGAGGECCRQHLARGDFEKRVDVDRMHEMSSLAVTFNKMAEELQKYEADALQLRGKRLSRATKPADLYSGASYREFLTER